MGSDIVLGFSVVVVVAMVVRKRGCEFLLLGRRILTVVAVVSAVKEEMWEEAWAGQSWREK